MIFSLFVVDTYHDRAILYKTVCILHHMFHFLNIYNADQMISLFFILLQCLLLYYQYHLVLLYKHNIYFSNKHICLYIMI